MKPNRPEELPVGTLSLLAALAIALPACAADVDTGAESSSEAVKKADAGSTSGSKSWDLSGWELQLPIGSKDNPQLVENPTNFRDVYFYVDTDGSLTFMDPRTGVTTSGSLHPRSELREVTSGWSARGKNTMTATVAVPTVPSKVTIGQVFQAPNAPSKPLLELQYEASGQLVLLLEKTNEGSAGGGAKFYDVGTVAKGQKFQYAISLSNDEIAISINSQTSTFALPPSFVGEKFYFKWGDYDQTATAGPESTATGTVVKFYANQVTHE